MGKCYAFDQKRSRLSLSICNNRNVRKFEDFLRAYNY